MGERRDQETSLSDKFWSAILGLLVLIGIVGFVAIIIIGVRGGSIPTFFVESGPFLLVLITLINIGLSGLSFLEGRKERRLTRKTLYESQKPGMVETLIRTTEPLLDSLSQDESVLNTTDGQVTKYTPLDDFRVPHEDLMEDLSYVYPNMAGEIYEYEEKRDCYNEARNQLEKQVAEEIVTTDILLDITTETPYGMSIDHMEGGCEKMAHIVMTGEKPEGCRLWVDNNIDFLRSTLLKLRNTDEFANEFSKIERLRSNTLDKNAEIQDNIPSAKEKINKEYKIRSAELQKELELREG